MLQFCVHFLTMTLPFLTASQKLCHLIPMCFVWGQPTLVGFIGGDKFKRANFIFRNNWLMHSMLMQDWLPAKEGKVRDTTTNVKPLESSEGIVRIRLRSQRHIDKSWNSASVVLRAFSGWILVTQWMGQLQHRCVVSCSFLNSYCASVCNVSRNEVA
jgi:hypothetical protein